MTTVTVQKWGNSLGILIPKEVAERLGMEQGSEMELSVSENIITLKPKKHEKNIHRKNYYHKLLLKIDIRKSI
jgi:antitoxin MazE